MHWCYIDSELCYGLTSTHCMPVLLLHQHQIRGSFDSTDHTFIRNSSRTSERFLHVLDDTGLVELVAFSVALMFLRCQKLYFCNHFMLQPLAE
jgi:hypothetical protein